MKKYLNKIIGWGSVLSAYVLLAVVVCLLLFDWDAGQLSQAIGELTAVASVPQGAQPILDGEHQPGSFSGILLPLGPRDGRLPGFSAIWREFSPVGPARTTIDGFDGLQAVENLADFFLGSVADLFLAGPPLQAFRRGDTLLILRGQGSVLLVDCKDPRLPKISGALPYRDIRQMEMRGDLAYFLVGKLKSQQSKLVIADLKNPYQPREQTQISLPADVRSFLLFNHHLVVYSNPGGLTGDSFARLYALSEDSQLTPLGRAVSPSLKKGFLKAGNYLFAEGLRAGMHVFDFSNPLQPVIAGFLDLPDYARQFARHGDRLFIFGELGNLYVVDVRDPAMPVLVSVLQAANHPAYFMELDRYTYFFTQNGHLQVFDARPSDVHAEAEAMIDSLAGELVALQAGAGFTLLDSHQGALPAAVAGVLTLPVGTTIVATAVWQERLVVLDDHGLVKFFRIVKDSPPEFQEQLQLTAAPRWLAAGLDRLYIGGESTVSIVSSEADDHFFMSGQFTTGGEDSWGGVVVGQTLCVAAGRAGLLSFSLEKPDHPVAGPLWTLPAQLGSLADVKQLAAVPGENRLLVAAGAAGLLDGTIDADSQFQLQGSLAFSDPVSAIALIAGFCLVPTTADVHVIDVNTVGSIQNLGKIALPNVTRIAVAAPDFWAGYVPGAGWSILPAPRRLSSWEAEIIQASSDEAAAQKNPYQYRLNLFNDHEVVAVPGVVNLAALPGRQRTAAP
jgi:hypothetical protein